MKEKNNRRNFLKAFLSAGAALGFTSKVKTPPNPEKQEKVKMLTADGKLVEVDKSVLEKAGLKKASDKEVYEWMDSKHKT